MTKAVRYIEGHGFFEEKLQKLARLALAKKNDPQDFIHWVRYVFEFGTEHLAQEQFAHFSFLQYFDLDTHFFIFAVLLLILWTAITLCRWVVWRCFSKH